MLVADLSERMVMERTTLVRALKPLREAGLVVSGKAAGMGRSLTLALSEEGTQKVAQAMPLWQAAQQEFEQSFGIERSEQLRGELWAVSQA